MFWLEAFEEFFAYFHSMHIRPMDEGGHYFVVTSLWDTLYVVVYFGNILEEIFLRKHYVV